VRAGSARVKGHGTHALEPDGGLAQAEADVDYTLPNS
jgi:hypothetical protein